MTKSITLRVLRNTELFSLYQKLITGQEMTLCERESILKIAIVFLNQCNLDVQNLGYRIIVFYCNTFKDYEPLYDIAINLGYIPVTKLIEYQAETLRKFDETFMNLFLSSFAETYKVNNIYKTSQQIELDYFLENNSKENIVIVAPTSYGKSERFVDFCNKHRDCSILIIAPTKALLSQLKARVQKEQSGRKIITHPEMYNLRDQNFIAILTQERLLRLLQENKDLFFDYVFVDEAHNLLIDDSTNQSRNLLLAKVIIILKYRSDSSNFIFLTPFLVDPENLNLKYISLNLKSFKVSENIKTERYFTIDFCVSNKPVLEIYDQYFNEFLKVSEEIHLNEFDLLGQYSGMKNIVYFNSPPKLEKFSKRLSSKLPKIEDEKILRACKDISEFLHEDYSLLDCMQKGIIYHHGSVPDVIKLYIENLYNELDSMKYIVSTSTLLEGVNIPAEKLFLFEYSKGAGNLSASQFKNLVGRICRFKEVFNFKNGSLKMLEPEVYLIKSEYMSKRANLQNFIKKTVKVDKKVIDSVENVLLESTNITEGYEYKIQKANEILENLEPGITGEVREYAQTDFGKSCFKNNIFEFNIIENEVDAQNLLRQALNTEEKIRDSEKLMEIVYIVFIQLITDEKYINLIRLSEEKARIFYKMFLDWKMKNTSYSEMINTFLQYWERRKVEDPFVYVHKWGDLKHHNSHRHYWVDIRNKTNKELVNLAIVRIKEEQDFLDNSLMKFVEVLNDLDLLEHDLYLKIKYGTIDINKIIMIKNGFSSGLSTLLIKKYPNYLIIDVTANTSFLKRSIEIAMRENKENSIYIFEATLYMV